MLIRHKFESILNHKAVIMPVNLLKKCVLGGQSTTLTRAPLTSRLMLVF